LRIDANLDRAAEKNLPVLRATTAREKLEAYLAAEIGHLEP
jgi:hypothetical protein